MTDNPETPDPPWLQHLIRRALEREMLRLHQNSTNADEIMERAMWHIFELRSNGNLTDLYREGGT